MSVAELLNNLIELQSVDEVIFDFKRQLNGIPVKLKVMDDEIEAASLNAKEKEEEIKKLQLERKDKEMDLGQKENTIKKYQTQLYQIKTNTEYTALEKEIGGLKADNSVLEEEILIIFDKIEIAEKELAEEKKNFEEEKKRAGAEKKKIDSEKAAIEGKLSEYEEKRKTITPLIDKKILSRYERILHNKDGIALVPTKGENCGGCFVNLPPQVINEIRAHEKIIYCERCARMLFSQE